MKNKKKGKRKEVNERVKEVDRKKEGNHSI